MDASCYKLCRLAWSKIHKTKESAGVQESAKKKKNFFFSSITHRHTFIHVRTCIPKQFGYIYIYSDVSKWVPTSELVRSLVATPPIPPSFHSLDHRSFAENSIIMIAYDVNDAQRQQLFPVERARWLLPTAGPKCSSLSFSTVHN